VAVTGLHVSAQQPVGHALNAAAKLLAYELDERAVECVGQRARHGAAKFFVAIEYIADGCGGNQKDTRRGQCSP
jgi:hypothetical protein